MGEKINRSTALRHFAALCAAVAIPGSLIACSKKPDCSNVSELSPDDLHIRNEVAKYVDQTLEAAKRCSGCMQYIAAAPDQCGACKVIKGPINPNGNCTLFVLKQG